MKDGKQIISTQFDIRDIEKLDRIAVKADRPRSYIIRSIVLAKIAEVEE